MRNIKFKKILIIIIAVIIFGLCFIPPKDYNCKYQLNIMSVYGDVEAYHPKVLNFENEWNGYKYWMCYTPYPQGDDSKENPHIAASNDLVNWEIPKGLINPLDERVNDNEPKQYNSDAHLVYNDDLNRIECYWRLVDDVNNKAIIYRSYTEDGVRFSDKEVALISNDRQKHDYVSPAIIYEDNIYKMWYIDKNNTLKYEESKNGIEWTEPLIIDFKYEDTKQKTWHIDVIHTEKGYELISVAYEKWATHNEMKLYYSYSEDEIKNWRPAVEILSPTEGTSYWDNRGIYRSSIIYEDGMYVLYYSGTNRNLHHGIGIMYGKNIEELNRVNTDFTNEKEIEKLVKKINREREQK